jgi:hypothetical protein
METAWPFDRTELSRARRQSHHGVIDERQANRLRCLARMQKILKLTQLELNIAEETAHGRQPVRLSLLFFVGNPLPDDRNAQWAGISGLAA